jgi:hypothetical protein
MEDNIPPAKSSFQPLAAHDPNKIDPTTSESNLALNVVLWNPEAQSSGSKRRKR